MKSIYNAGKVITPEKLQAKKGFVTKSREVTKAYLRKLNSAADTVLVEQNGTRFRG